MELEKRVFDIKKSMLEALGRDSGGLETSFDQASVLYPKRFMFDYEAPAGACHGPKDVVDAFFDAVNKTGICLSKYDLHVTVL